MSEIDDMRSAAEEVTRSKVISEKQNKNLLLQLNDANKKVDESNFMLTEYQKAKQKLNAENSELLRQLQELENTAYASSRSVESLAVGLEEQKQVCNEEAKERSSLLSKYRNLEHQYDGFKENYDDEVMTRENLMQQLKKAEMDSEAERKKYEVDGLKKIDELEMSKLKLQSRLSEAQNTLDNLNAKQQQLDKAKSKVEADITDINGQLDQAFAFNAAMEKRARQCER